MQSRAGWQGLSGVILLLVLLLAGGVVSAREYFNGDVCQVEADAVVEGNLFVLCDQLTIAGEIHGDLIGAASQVTLLADGRVRGNVYLVAGQFDVRGVITDDLHFGGLILRLNPPPERTLSASATPDAPDSAARPSLDSNPAEQADDDPPDTSTLPSAPQRLLHGSLKAIAFSTTLYDDTRIGEGIIMVGYQLDLQGRVNGEISYWGSSLRITGLVDDDVYATVGDPLSDSSQLEALLLPLQFDLELRNPGLVLAESGAIAGTLAYRGPAAGQLDGIITGDVIYDDVEVPLTTLEEPADLAVYGSQFVREFTTLLVIGAGVLLLTPQLVQLPLTNMRIRPFGSFSVGMLAFLLSFPVVVIVLVISAFILVVLQVIGLSGLVVAVGILLALVNVGGGSLFYFVAIFVARAIVALAVGRFLLRVTLGRDAEMSYQYVALLLGVGVLAALVSLPVVGPFVNAGALFMGLGTLFTVMLDRFRRIRETSPTPAPAWYTPSPAITRQRATVGVPDVQVMPLPDADDTNEAAASAETDALGEPETIDAEATDVDATAPDDEASDTDTDDTHDADTPPAKPPTYPTAGLDNLPEGFDMSFFEDD